MIDISMMHLSAHHIYGYDFISQHDGIFIHIPNILQIARIEKQKVLREMQELTQSKSARLRQVQVRGGEAVASSLATVVR